MGLSTSIHANLLASRCHREAAERLRAAAADRGKSAAVTMSSKAPVKLQLLVKGRRNEHFVANIRHTWLIIQKV